MLETAVGARRRVSRNNNRDFSCVRDFHAGAIGGGILDDFRGKIAPAHRIGERGEIGLARFWFSTGGTRGRMLAPMVKDVWNVNDDPRLIGGAQREIIILREIELLAPTAEFLHQR